MTFPALAVGLTFGLGVIKSMCCPHLVLMTGAYLNPTIIWRKNFGNKMEAAEGYIRKPREVEQK